MYAIVIGVVIGVAAIAYVIYQMVKAKKAVTVANVVAQAKTDAGAASNLVKKA